MPQLSLPSPTSSQTTELLELGRGVVWHCCPLRDARPRPDAAEALRLAVSEFVAELGGSGDEVLEELVLPPTDSAEQAACFRGGANKPTIGILVPEASADLDFCRWDGDGHYNIPGDKAHGPPTLGQVMSFVQTVKEAADRARLTIFLSSDGRRATGAVLAGAVLVLVGGLSATEAWSQILRCSPAPAVMPEAAWDRFPAPFSKNGATTSSSVRVVDCLAGLEFARDAKWVDPENFDVSGWRFLRRKFDASWLIPDELLAMANPWGTAQNPAFPGLLQPSERLSARPPLQVSPPCAHDPPGSPMGSVTPASFSTRIDSVDMADVSNEFGPQFVMREFEATVISSSPAQSSSWAPEGADVSERESTLDTTSLPAPPFLGLPNGEAMKKKTVETEGLATYKDKVSGLVGDTSLALASTVETSPDGQATTSETELVRNSGFVAYLRAKGVSPIVRLSNMYECQGQAHYIKLFQDEGFDTVAFPFDDGETPPKATVENFLRVCGKARTLGNQAFAVHCMGGLGRTGVMAGVYAVNRHNISGTAFHGWTRMCRAGTVQTLCQERYLRSLEPQKQSKDTIEKNSRPPAASRYFSKAKSFCFKQGSPGATPRCRFVR